MKNPESEKINFSGLNIRNNWAAKALDFDDIYIYTFVIMGIFVAFVVVSALIPQIRGYLFVGGFIVAFILWWRNVDKYEKNKQTALQNFAKNNSFVFEEYSKAFGPSTLFLHGHSKSKSNIISGMYCGLPFQYFEYSYSTGSGKWERDYNEAVMELTLPRKLPHMVIDSLVEPGNYLSSTLPIKFDKAQKIDLEGDFYKYFAIYAPDKYGVSALTIIAPDVMETLMAQAAMCDVEIIENRLYFYWTNTEFVSKRFKDNFVTVEKVLDKIYKKLTTSDIFAHKSQAKVHAEGSRAVRLEGSSLGRSMVYVIIGLGVAELFAFALPELGGITTLAIYGWIFWWAWKQYKIYRTRNEILARFHKYKS